MRNAQAYVQPRSLDEAVALVRDRPGRAAFLGGGTRLAQNDDPSLETLVDLAALGLDALEATPSGSRIGAMVPLERLRQSPPAALANGVLADALGRTRSIAWRNQATLGGRLREAEPTDLITTALLLLDAVCVVQAAPCVPPATVPVSRLADLPAEGEWFGVYFKLGTFMPAMKNAELRDLNDVTLPSATRRSFWLDGSAWEFPTFANVETFVERLVRRGLILTDRTAERPIRGEPLALSARTEQRRVQEK